jgi:hypothetical protein
MKAVFAFIFYLIFSFVVPMHMLAQNVITKPKSDTTKNTKKLRIATYAQTGIVVGTLATLNAVWYSKEPRQKLASFNDSKEWLQMDKIGHGFSTYSEAKLSYAIWKWGGLSHKKSVLLGTSMAWLYQMSFEIMDGTVASYGFSWTDVAANTLGAGLFAFQALHWNEQRIVPKLSYWRQKYDPSVLQRVRDLYGTNGLERFLKDYNGQTHWLSGNLRQFFPKSTIPNWLNIAVGYSANGMLGGFENKWKDANGNTITRYDIKRVRQWYLAPDIDFSKFKTNNKVVKVLFFFLNSVKMPLPALSIDGGKVKFKSLVF